MEISEAVPWFEGFVTMEFKVLDISCVGVISSIYPVSGPHDDTNKTTYRSV